MSPEQWKHVERIYNEALEYKVEERFSFIAKACSGDTELRREVESLLEANAKEFLERPAGELVAQVMARSMSASGTGRVQPGRKLGPYQIADLLGKGGMGEVYRATDTRLHRTVAVKILLDAVATDPQGLERFEREARAISRLNHPHICTLHDVGEQDGIHYLVMELVEGETLASRLKKGRLASDQILEYTIQIAAALDEAHQHGVIHRDLKPDNIMITKSGVKVLDFGLAKLKGDRGEVSRTPQISIEGKPLTARGTILGTLPYMAPEQLEGKDSDARTDIFAFGAIAYEMVTGEKAFKGESQARLIGAIMNQEPEPMRGYEAIARPLDPVVRTCLAKNPKDRWQSAGDLMREIRRLTSKHESARSVSRKSRFGKRVFAALFIVVAFTSAAAWWRYIDLPHFLSDPANVQRATPAEFDSASPVRIGVVSAVPGEKNVTPWTERHGLVLWIAVGLAVATLGMLAIRAMQK